TPAGRGRGRAEPALPRPQARQRLELLVEEAPATVEVEAAERVVVLAPARREAEHEAAAGQVVDRRALLGEQRGARPQRRDHDVGHEPDPLGTAAAAASAISDS